jgi:hypothetical protein
MSKILSVKELNIVLDKLQKLKKDEKISKENIIEGVFSEVDIVFVAGLLLWHMQYEDDSLLASIDFSNVKIEETIRGRDSLHQNYFKQIKELYKIDCQAIFRNFPSAKRITTHIYSGAFAPILYINKATLNWLFVDINSNNIFNNIKNEYIKYLKESNSNNNEKKYFELPYNITKSLEISPAINTFVFSVIYHNIKPFVNNENRDFIEIKKDIDKIWQFTKDYVRSLYELAKNITEHSKAGVGMITIRAYYGQDEETWLTKVLETHVFDYGETGIIPQFYEYTKIKSNDTSIRKEIIKKAYINDYNRLKKGNFDLKKLITPEKGEELEQQTFRYIRHYGINNLKSLVTDKLKGEIYISTNTNDDREGWKIYPDIKSKTKPVAVMDRMDNVTANKETLCIGTSYHFSIPIDYKIVHSIETLSPPTEIQTLGDKKALTELFNKNIKRITFEQLINENNIEEIENTLFDITFDEKTTKEFYQQFDILDKLNNNNIFALNLKIDDKTNVINEGSNLLRLLSYLTFFSKPFIIYNIDYEIHREMLEDNRDFIYTRKDNSEAYWHRENAILLFVRLDGKKIGRDNHLYFADLLFGNTENEFLYVNKIVNNTFPNTITITSEEKKQIQNFDLNIESNNNLKCFLQGNSLLPYESLLTDNNKPLYTYNLQTILQLPLVRPGKKIKLEISGTEKIDNQIFDPIKALKNYIDNLGGYCISGTHFKIGNKLHSEQFYYAKRLFQNSFYTTRLAMMLAIKIKEKTQITDKLLLIGYEMYSELLLSLVSKYLETSGYKEIKHFIGIDNDGKFIFKPDEDIFFMQEGNNYFSDCKAIIIVPIASTGNTAIKIREAVVQKGKGIIELSIEKEESTNNINLTEKIDKEIDNIKFSSDLIFNVIVARDKKTLSHANMNELMFKNYINITDEAQMLVELPAIWHLPKECKLCGFGVEGFNINKALFYTDKSYLTPALIFGLPKGKNTTNKDNNDITEKQFNKDNFKKSLSYRRVWRNNEYYHFSTYSPRFIKENKNEILIWFKNITECIKIKSTDRVVLLAPCHETNSEFLNLVNEHIFNSSAIIIYHQTNVDYIENFRILNEEFLGHSEKEDIKVFYADDNLISGKQFFEIYNLFRNTAGKEKKLCGAILLRDSSTQETHDNFFKEVNHCHVFMSYNLPPALSINNEKPFEHERKRYEDLRNYVLHDVLIKTFDEKEKEFDLEGNKVNNKHAIMLEKTVRQRIEMVQKKREEEQENNDKYERHLRMFEVTNNVYDFFKKGTDISQISPDNDVIKIIDKFLIKYFKDSEEIENKIALLKVLSHYPFLLYKPLKEITFEWHKTWLINKIQIFNEKLDKTIEKNKEPITKEEYQKIFTYDDFCELKFLIRRAVFLDNLKIIDSDFLRLILRVFIFISEHKMRKYNGEGLFKEEYRLQNLEYENNNLLQEIENIDTINNMGFLCHDNLINFPIFLIRNYMELIQKNGWIAIKLKNNMDHLKKEFENSNCINTKRFYRMMQIEFAAVVEDLMKMIEKEHYTKWRNICGLMFIKNTLCIKDFFNEEKDKLINGINKYEIVKEMFNLEEDWYLNKNSSTPFENYLWIKHMIFVDRDAYPPTKIEYQEKIDEIINKMKQFFPIKDIQAFFIVADGQQTPHVVSDKYSILKDFKDEYEEYKTTEGENSANNIKYEELINFLKGKKDKQNIARITISEYKKVNNINWKELYNNEEVKIKFLRDEHEWLLIIRISQADDDFKPLGVLGFYSKTDLSESRRENLLPKQLLMLLRKDIGKFIEKHHKNDEFSEFIKQKEKNKYVLRLSHGVKEYKEAIEDILEYCIDEKLKKKLYAFYDYLITKINLIDKLSSDINKELIKLQIIKNEFLDNYEKILSLNVSNIDGLQEEKIQTSVKLIIFENDNLDEEYYFPESSIKDIVFELLNNIRKNVCNMETYLITEDNPLIIEVSIIEENNKKYLSVTNNHVRILDSPNYEYYDIPHGIDLLEQMWHTLKLGKIITPTFPLQERNYYIKLQLNSGDSEK